MTQSKQTGVSKIRNHIYGDMSQLAALAARLGYISESRFTRGPNLSALLRAINDALADERNFDEATGFLCNMLQVPDNGKD